MSTGIRPDFVLACQINSPGSAQSFQKFELELPGDTYEITPGAGQMSWMPLLASCLARGGLMLPLAMPVYLSIALRPPHGKIWPVEMAEIYVKKLLVTEGVVEGMEWITESVCYVACAEEVNGIQAILVPTLPSRKQIAMGLMRGALDEYF